ncbi:SsgA family sporulation/cell division regulator [Kitasatospora sp. NPDC052896]|uniref:SsgA family sporulation/cell division regulator n=1 Tax=Kitasatospora sp. NPDC052896 TaxID=3364061 RepID=UPI0037C63D9A
MPNIEKVVNGRLVITTQRLATVPVTWRYDKTDPLAVSMVFSADTTDPVEAPEDDPACRCEIVWTFSRELFAAGLDIASGIGDVRIRPTMGEFVIIELRSRDDGTAVLVFERSELRRFLWASYQAIPAGGEPVDMDQAVAELLRYSK